MGNDAMVYKKRKQPLQNQYWYDPLSLADTKPRLPTLTVTRKRRAKVSLNNRHFAKAFLKKLGGL